MENQLYMMVKFRVGILSIKKKQIKRISIQTKTQRIFQ